MKLTDAVVDEEIPTNLDLEMGTITDKCEFYNSISNSGVFCRLSRSYVSEESCINKNSCPVYIKRMGELSS